MVKKIALGLFVLAVAAFAFAAETAPAAHPGVFTPKDVAWGPGPPFLPPGVKLAVLEGDPGAAGSYVLRLSMPDGYKIPPHHHPTVENVTVISGEFHLGMGDKFDAAAGKTLPPGTFGYLPAEMNHYAWAKGRTVVQVHGEGPFAITYVNAADDPRTAKH
ncbi:MAG TPA: cupin domain-containing protein [Thermoanaerobaculia bacterium]|nr:cupin domain-containing protein [Thermoanaerobaculia bacterium]